jgi:signal transduction histidine kinase
MQKNKKQKKRRGQVFFSHIPLALKLGLCCFFLIFLMFVFLNTYGLRQMQIKLLTQEESKLYSMCSLLADELPDTISEEALADFSEQLGFCAKLKNCRLWVVDLDSKVCYDSNSPKKTGLFLSDYQEDFLEETAYRDTTVGDLLLYHACAVIYPMTNDFQMTGYLVALYPLSQLKIESIAYTDVYNLCFLLYCIVILLIFFVLYRITVSPLKKNIRAVQEFSSGKYDYKPKIATRDEYEELAQTTAFLAGELKNLEDYQKKIIGNISHDLRSPLTSIKGYAEAMADGTIPVEMQEKYLNIIVHESTRLTKLSQNLLTLNSYENRGALLNLSVFDINEAIRQTALSFEGTGRKKGIQIRLLFEETSLFVNADMEKIEQVLYNLLDNAIKFSYENKSIRITTKRKGTKAMISVKDKGVGIPKESLPKIFDRFYKTDSSRGRDKKGTGLGLAIVKDIISAHKEQISVVSTEGAGTEFTFSLGVAQKN